MPDDGRSRLGRGLAALTGDVSEEPKVTNERARNPRRVSIELLKPNPRNPRHDFSESELEELAASIKERGIIQPIVVRPVRGSADNFEIIAGERRWRAAQRAGLHDVPIVPIDATDGESLELAIIENVQRSDLNPLEEAMGYQALASEFTHSADDIGKIVGKSRSHVANTLRLLKLSDTVKALINAGKLTAGHARMLIGQPNADALAEEIVSRGLNVRQVEAMARQSGKEQATAVKPKRPPGKDADTTALEKRLSDVLGLQVSIEHRDGHGTLQIHYRNLDQLEDVLRRLERGAGS